MKPNLPFGFYFGRVSQATTSDAESRQLALTGFAIPNDSKRKSSASSDPAQTISTKGLAGRKSTETNTSPGTFAVWNSFAANRKKNFKIGLDSEFSLEQFQKMDFDELAELLSDLSPEISKALWDYLLMCNGGYECKALKLDAEDDAVDDNAQIALNTILSTIGVYNGTTGVFFDRIFRTIFMRGSMLMELVLADNGRDFVDIATPDTSTLAFQRRLDPNRGQCWDFGQWQGGTFVSLDLANIRYVPVHPSPGSIEGHSLCSAAFFCALFLMSVLHDTKRVVQNQGYMRMDLTIMFEKMLAAMPSDLTQNPDAVQEWMDKITEDIARVYRNLKPTDTYVHSDAVSVNKPVGTASSDALKAIDALFLAIERMLIRAVKSMPILMGSAGASVGGRSETHANREWEIYAKGIETVQHLVESPFEYLMELALRAQGIQARVKMRFAKFRAAEEMRDAQVDMLKAQVARANFDNGYISQDEAALYSVNKEKSDQPEPRVSNQPTLGNSGADLQLSGGATDPEPSSAKRFIEPDEVSWWADIIDFQPPKGRVHSFTTPDGRVITVSQQYNGNLSGAPDTSEDEIEE